jgi:hypothetical protein
MSTCRLPAVRRFSLGRILAVACVAMFSLALPGASLVSADYGDAAGLASQSPYPTIDAGQSIHIFMTARNIGSTTWSANRGYGYVGKDGWAAYGQNSLWRDVSPQETITFEDTVTPPSQPGTYNYGFILTHNGQTFGPYYFIPVTVRGKGDPRPASAPVHCPDGSQPLYYDPNRGIDCQTFSSAPFPPSRAAQPVQSYWTEAIVDNGTKLFNAGCLEFPDIEKPEVSGGNFGQYESYSVYWGWSYIDANGVSIFALEADGSAGPYTVVGSMNAVSCDTK